MKMTKFKNSLSTLLCALLIAAMAMLMGSCDNNTNEAGDVTQTTTAAASATVLGDGARQFMFTVVDANGNQTEFEIHTDCTTVGDALIKLGLIAGDQGEFGLYVKTVNGITVDYDTDGKYWAFYQNGEYASAGVDQTEITDGAQYSFKVE